MMKKNHQNLPRISGNSYVHPNSKCNDLQTWQESIAYWNMTTTVNENDDYISVYCDANFEEC